MGAPWKCEDCGSRWYSNGPPSGACLDCESESIEIDTGIPVADTLRRLAEKHKLDDELSEGLIEAAETIDEIATALPVLRTMCRVAKLSAGERRADEMLKSLEVRQS